MNDDTKSIQILVIDDDRAIRHSLRILLGWRGFAIAEAGTAAEGVERFLEHHPQLVMCDMVMPGSPGVSAIASIRDIDAGVPIIAMSGSIQGGSNGYLDRARAAGADLCLEKPFEAEELFAAIDQLLDR